MRGWLKLFLGGMIMGTLSARAAITYTMGTPIITNYVSPGYVIDSDGPRNQAGYFRHLIPVRMPVTVGKSGSGSESSANMVVRFRLRNQNTGELHPLQGGATTITTSPQSAFFLSPGTNVLNFNTNLVPTAKLNPYTAYRVEAEVINNSNSSIIGTNQSVNHTFIHFRGPWGSDTALNVVPILTTPSLTRQWLADTDASQTNFLANLNFTLHRYDQPTVSPATNTVLVRYVIELQANDAPETPIPLASGIIAADPTPGVPTYLSAGGGLLQRPAAQVVSQQIAYRPAPGVQLDSVGKTHRLQVRLEHIEEPATFTYVAGPTRANLFTRFLHFNGRLEFGSMLTTIRSITNTPTTGATVVSPDVQTTLGLGFNGALLEGFPGYTAGPGLIDIGLRPDGSAYCRSPSSIGLVSPGIDLAEWNGVRFFRNQLTLDATGAKSGQIEVILPAGFGWATTSTARRHEGTIIVNGPHQLDDKLLPTADLTRTPPGGGQFWVAEETKPVTMRVNSITWQRLLGRFEMPTFSPTSVVHVRQNQYVALSNAPVASGYKIKPSNDSYWRTVSGIETDFVVQAGYKGGAELSGVFEFGGNGALPHVTHFPDRAIFQSSTGLMRVVNDRVHTEDSYLNVGAAIDKVYVPVSADCVEPGCGSTSPTNAVLSPDNLQLRFTTDGGLVATGDMTPNFALRWGWIPSLGRHAHQTDSFARGSVHLPGHFLHGDYTTVLGDYPLDRRAAVILLSGANPDSGQVTERPGGIFGSYFWGHADYAGMNFRAGPSNSITASGLEGESTLGGGAYGPYDLKGRSKYYVRRSGVSGIHDKVQTAPQLVLINGYQFTFLNFGLAFLSNENTDSRTEGSLYLPQPTDATIDFEKLMFLCNGALDKADVQNGPQSIVAKYWEAPIDVSAIEFTRDPAQLCNPGNGFLALGVDAYMAHVSDSFQGKLGVFPHGNFIPRNGGPTNLDSRLLAPSQVKVRGPRRAAPGASGYETYFVTPTVGAFFNTLGSAPNYVHPASNPAAPLDKGFINLPGLVKVSFFEALPAHLQTASHRPPANSNNPGVWGNAELFLANGTWSSKSFFQSGYHDPDNRGFPGSTAANLVNYRTNATYFIRAKQEWLGGAIEFDFPVRWDFPTRSFRSVNPVKDDFVVLNMEQRVAYLSAERAEVRFGAQVGLPQVNLANFVLDTVGEATGMATAVSNALGSAVTGALNTGLDRMSDLLADRMEEHFERFLGSSLDSLANQIHAHLLTQWTGTGWVGGSAPSLSNYFAGAFPLVEQQVWNKLGGGTGSQIAELGNSLDQTVAALDTLTGPQGLLRPGGNDTVDPALVRTLVRVLIEELAGEVSGNLAAVVGNLAGAELDALLAPHLESAAPTLADLRNACVELRASLAQVRSALNGQFGTELNNLLADALSNEFNAVNGKIRTNIRNYLGTFNANNRFNLASATVVKQKLRRSVTDQFYTTAYVAAAQSAIKHRLFDLNGALRSTLDSTFGQVNEIVKGALTSAFTDLDTGFSNVLGLFSGVMASAGIDGYAVFNGDALRQVRVDGKFQWSVPEKTTFNAFMEINQYQSGADESLCGAEGKDTAEVILGAVNVPFDFLSPDLRADIGTKFSFDITPQGKLQPIGFAGSVQKTAGEVSFEAFAITDLAVAVAFGEQENYLSAALGLRFNSYKAKGGIFFGRTCTLAPIMMWDLFVAGALGKPDPTFTGAYVYGEAHIPVSEAILGIPASCMFQVSAGMGLGIFYFIEGPTYGARGKLAVSGDALCMLSLGGELNMTGLKQGSKFKLKGQGSVYVEIGVCPVCVEASRTVTFTTETGGGKAKGSKPSVK
jgi:hypothetical protein